ncbi:hypothetical protein RN001_008075 [Aquatica leii]|uniref:Neprilysin n=1 Tax=Aquatica leii TaxID=1421715 RepID=A0AAN7SH46_9COLE|nr:hypothetical protein RN001_008075 [Aquatica leii]
MMTEDENHCEAILFDVSEVAAAVTNDLLPVAIIISTAIAASINDFQSKKCTDALKCNSEVCNRVSQEVLENLDETVNPCDNFYQFACGGYIKSRKIPDDQTIISTLSEINTLVINQLNSIVKEPINATEPATFKLAKQFYNVCMNTNATEENNLKTAKNLLKKLGGWPIIEGASWNEDDFDWKKQMYKFRRYGFDVNTFLDTTIGVNVENSSQRIVSFDQADLPVNRLNLVMGLANPIVKSYYNYLIDLAVIFGADRDEATLQVKEVMEFMFKLAKITLPPEDRRNFTALTNIMSIAELKQRFPYMDWIDFINNIIAIPSIQFNETDNVDVGIPKFIDDLEVLLSKTPKRTQANYAMSIAVASIAYALNKNVRDREFQLMQEVTGTKTVVPKWNECLNRVAMRLKVAIGSLYARTFFNQNSKATVELLVSSLHLKLLKMLNEVDWMDEETKTKALAKAASVESYVGYPPELMDDKIIDEFYATIKPSDDYLEFVVNIQTFESDRKFKSIREKVQKAYWVDNSDTHNVNAFYNLVENIIILPAGILQGMMFDVDRPKAMNFGAIGFIIGHELTHGYDDMGKQINKDGQLQNWWSDTTSVEYMKKTECIVKQYNNYTIDRLKLKLNGIITQGENIADNGGAKLAYETYQSWLKHNGNDKCLPNLNYTQNQLFWIAFANAWCTSQRDEQFRTEMLASAHPPAYFRVLGIISNSKYFARDFECPLGSPMNPEKVHIC